MFGSWQVWQTCHPPGSSHPVLLGDGTVSDSSRGSGSPAVSLGFATGVTLLPLGPGRCQSRSQPQPLAS